MEGTQGKDTRPELNCDQAAWLIDVLSRFEEVQHLGFTRISRLKEMAKVSAVLEICEVMGYKLEKGAVNNILPLELKATLAKQEDNRGRREETDV